MDPAYYQVAQRPTGRVLAVDVVANGTDTTSSETGRRHRNAHDNKAGRTNGATIGVFEAQAEWAEKSPARCVPGRCRLRWISDGTSLARREHHCERRTGDRIRPWVGSSHGHHLVTDRCAPVGGDADLAQAYVVRGCKAKRIRAASASGVEPGAARSRLAASGRVLVRTAGNRPDGGGQRPPWFQLASRSRWWRGHKKRLRRVQSAASSIGCGVSAAFSEPVHWTTARELRR